MAKFTPAGLQAYLQKIDPTATPVTAIPATGITNAKPAVVTVGSTAISGITEGALVTMSGTLNASLDGKTFVAEKIDATAGTFELKGSDLSKLTSALTAGSVRVVPSANMLSFCLRQFEREVEAADAIDVSTFCGAESLAGTPSPGTITVEGFIDYQSAAYNEWRQAVKDGLRRLFHIKLPASVGGDILMTITPSGLTETFEINEAAAFSGEAVINEEPMYLI